jgi:hypothetical protein
MALVPALETVVLGVVPDVVPAVADDPAVEAVAVTARAGVVSTLAEGVYLTEVVSAFDPADCDAEDEKLVDAPAPVAPEEAFDWM